MRRGDEFGIGCAGQLVLVRQKEGWEGGEARAEEAERLAQGGRVEVKEGAASSRVALGSWRRKGGDWYLLGVGKFRIDYDI